MGGPVEMAKSIISLKRGQILDRNDFLRSLVGALYVRNDIELKRGNLGLKEILLMYLWLIVIMSLEFHFGMMRLIVLRK